MKTEREHRMFTDRYEFDFKTCTYANGFAQFDTKQDASYFGTWVSPSERKIVSYCEGDLTVQVADADEEFVALVRELVRWNEERDYGPARIDALSSPVLKAAFERLGLADILH